MSGRIQRKTTRESLPELYVDVVLEAGEQARATKDKGWTALFIAGVAVGVAAIAVYIYSHQSVSAGGGSTTRRSTTRPLG